MRVLNVCETAKGGVGTYQAALAAMSGMGVEMHYLVPEQDADFLGGEAKTYTFDRRKRGVFSLLAMLYETRRLIKELQPDLCFFHSSFALAGLAMLRGPGARRPALYCPHGWAIASHSSGGLKSRIIRAVEGRLAGLADTTVCVSQHEKDLADTLGYHGRRVVIENAVPPPRPDARDDLFHDEPDALHLLFVGRLDRQKGFDILAQAMRLANRPDVRLSVVGGAVRGDGASGDIPQGTTLVGWVDPSEIDHWHRSADALIVPSRWEGLPLVILEAFRNGTPVICSERSGMEALVTRGVTGDHFDLTPEALAKVLRGLDKSALRAMRPACRDVFETRFSIARLHRELFAVMQEAVAK
ncbi:glycosyltransferase family 4 protein [Aestuariicoccus sp. MJ-SS9]|uniref:glycosyltransferase family 4 protein n=1 Tax=Aestuariicoccus sp. MJ-SS9 TaxID=3079855 RepID=UPI002913E1B4|nr:glycosyltransferase family 4 protein [Aestuariicoccus sp. MJ-SS9]MDU8911000.1 glycosyltransferase family 4 protein [Aestuariicoccus sp. MJ-SS9]